MSVAWVVGAGGLLGRSLVCELEARGADLYAPPAPLAWSDARAFEQQMPDCVAEFARRARARSSWEIYWAAGISRMGSSEGVLSDETRRLEALLACLAARPELHASRGAFALASSAGGIYAGSTEPLLDESAAPAPTTAYARGKLRQEEIVRGSRLVAQGCRALLARISTLYGPGQSNGRRQGLIAHVARSVLANRPVRIFVPLDTVRDYVYADDAARIIVASLRSSARDGAAEPVVRLVASGQPTTIAEILGTFGRVSRKRLRFTTEISELSRAYAGRARFQSRVLPEHSRLATTPLLVGVSRVLEAERVAAVRGPGRPQGGCD